MNGKKVNGHLLKYELLNAYGNLFTVFFGIAFPIIMSLPVSYTHLFLVSMSRGIVFVIAGITLLPRFLGTSGVWLTVPFAEFMAFLVGVTLLRMTSKRLTSTESDEQLLS